MMSKGELKTLTSLILRLLFKVKNLMGFFAVLPGEYTPVLSASLILWENELV